jgi:biotin carboxyl carrier protein
MKHEVKAPVSGSVWMHCAGVGQKVYAGNQVLILESMKMEIPVESPVDGALLSLAAPGTVVNEGDVVAVVED